MRDGRDERERAMRRGRALVTTATMQTIIERFKAGGSIYSLATAEGLTVQTIERLIRNAMLRSPARRATGGR